ncbi:N-alpha-acetyltransferase 35, NatC auxiliary subunit isoform X1 [Oopsacas minuta]|uniref:Protein MAK10 homolog n=1 Tax=Oopsacas minuta TaxID=111878 RepID=A0AAV7JVX9_9METZ|nr:N-alpha-acetyltransferase 35, NatC auxiliary subunit isoform X1 [Oopsacas minuta]
MALRNTTNQSKELELTPKTTQESQCNPNIKTATIPDQAIAPSIQDIFSDYENITEAIRTACIELDLGEMIHVDSFTLLDGMSAIELGDAKTDEKCTQKEAILESGIREDMSDGEVIAVLDQLLCCLATWLEGNTLVQTVFSFYYTVNSDDIQNRIVRCFTRTLVKIMFSFKEAVHRAGVQEEEDAMDLSFNYSFLEDIQPNAIKEELANTIEWYCSNKNLSPANLMDDLTLEESLVLRLRLIQVLYSVTCLLDMFPDLSFMETAYSHITDAIKLIAFISKTHCYASEVTQWSVYGFGSSDLTLLPPNPRKTSLLPFNESAVCLKYSLEDIASVISILRHDNFRAIYQATTSFSKDPIEKFRPNVLARSYLKSMICYREHLFGNFQFDIWLKDEIKFFCNPPSLNSTSKMSAKPQTRKLVNLFLTHVQDTVIEVMHYLCLSRARQYTTLQQTIFQSLGQMLADADSFDVQLHKIGEQFSPQEAHTGYYVSWVLYHLLQIMTDYLQLGFEYDLYSLFEYHYIFWYLEYLLGCRQSCGEMIQNLLAATSEAVGKKGKGSGAKKRNKKDLETKVQAFDSERIFLNILRLINIGYLRAIEGLKLANKIICPEFDLGKKEYCYEQRFLPFSYLSTPSPLLYEKYVKNSDIDQLNPEDRDKMLQSSSKHFQVAKTGLDNIDVKSPEQEKILKVVKMNIVTMNLAASGHKMNNTNPPQFDFSISKQFPIIRLF